MTERAKPSTNKAKRRNLKDAFAVEVAPDAWERFEKAVGQIAPAKKPAAKSGAEKSDAGKPR